MGNRPQLIRFLHQFGRDERGATIVEFSIVAVIFFMLMMAVVEYGMFTMTQVTIQSAVDQASRVGSISTNFGNDRIQEIRQIVQDRTRGLPRHGQVVISTGLLSSPTQPNGTVTGGAVNAPDVCLADMANPRVGGPCPANASGVVRYEDLNGNNQYDDGTGVDQAGGGGDYVELRVSYPWRVLFPVLGRFFGQNGIVMITSTAVIRNEDD